MSIWPSMDRVTCRDPMTRVRTSAVSISTLAGRGSVPLAAGFTAGDWRRVIPHGYSGGSAEVCDTHVVGLVLNSDSLLLLFMKDPLEIVLPGR